MKSETEISHSGAAEAVGAMAQSSGLRSVCVCLGVCVVCVCVWGGGCVCGCVCCVWGVCVGVCVGWWCVCVGGYGCGWNSRLRYECTVNMLTYMHVHS